MSAARTVPSSVLAEGAPPELDRPAEVADLVTAGLLNVGEETIQRGRASAATAAASGTLRLSFFTCRKSGQTTQVKTISSAAAVTPTVNRIGLYLVDDVTGDGALVASTVHDAAIWAAVGTAYTKAWAVAYAKVLGARYALGLLSVAATGATWPGTPTLAAGMPAEAGVLPRLSGVLTAQADLPNSFTQAALTASDTQVYGVLL